MDRTYIKDNQIIERYLLDRLSAAERDTFEQFFLTDQATRDELELARRFLDGLRSVSDQGSDAT